MKKRVVFVAALSILGLTVTFGAAKKPRREFQVRALSYRAFPHENPNAAVFAACYGAGADSSFWGTLHLTCPAMTTPPPAVAPSNFHFIEVYNLVEADGSTYAITCQAGWVGTDCTWLAPGSTFQAEVEDWTMWVTSPASKGPSKGHSKDIRRKFRLLEVQRQPQAASNPPPEAGRSATTPATPPGDVIPPGSYFGVVRNAPQGISVRFGIAVGEESGSGVSASISGCMEIHLPLYGSGAISGTIKGKEISFDAVGPNYVLKLRGELQGNELKGTYAVAPDDDDGAFVLRRLSADTPAAGLAVKDCLKTLISLDPPGPFSH